MFCSAWHARVDLHERSEEADGAALVYPDVAFAVHEFETLFEAAVLSGPRQCYCVLLCAVGGPALARPDATGALRPARVVVFSGYVVAADLQEALKRVGAPAGWAAPAPHSLLDSPIAAMRGLLAKVARVPPPQPPPPPTPVRIRVQMRGPGGQGLAEVAVSSLPPPPPPPSQQQEPQQQPLAAASAASPGSSTAPLGRMWDAVAGTAAKGLAAAKSLLEPVQQTTGAAEPAGLQPAVGELGSQLQRPLNCCLMSIRLPWQIVARAVLFDAGIP